MKKDFWLKESVAVLGGGNFGTVLAHIAAQNCAEVRMWVRGEEDVKAINVTRTNPRYTKDLVLSPKIKAFSDPARIFEDGVSAVIWALPSAVCRSQAKILAKYFKGHEILLHATKGIEEGSLKRITEVLREELPCPRIGVISGPNLAGEIARGDPAATVVASYFKEVQEAGGEILAYEKLRVYTSRDVIGVEWAGTLKNILAIASGALNSLGYGWNARSMLITRGLAEMVRFGVAMGADAMTFLGLAGAGDLIATCSSPQSRNYRVGEGLAQGKSLQDVIAGLGSTAEGVKTTQIVYQHAKERGIYMPITEGVYHILMGKVSVGDALKKLMEKPVLPDLPVGR